jgi:hypothetical protein
MLSHDRRNAVDICLSSAMVYLGAISTFDPMRFQRSTNTDPWQPDGGPKEDEFPDDGDEQLSLTEEGRKALALLRRSAAQSGRDN